MSKLSALYAASFLSSLGMALGGQALVGPIENFYDSSALVVVVDVKKVTMVEVATGSDGVSNVYVAEAEVLRTLKSDHTPTPAERTIAIVGSTIPGSSAVWEPIERKRYLAFLNPEQGHYVYGEKYAMRPISADGKVDWIEKNGDGDFEIRAMDVEEAIKKIRGKGGE
jgi:hypothetical protein